MPKHLSEFVPDGYQRLLSNPNYRKKLAAIEAEIRKKYSAELSAATNDEQRVAVKEKLDQEIKRSRPSPYCLWSSG